MSDVVARFHQVLVEEIRAHRPDYLTGPFTVAEIYQNLVPYGSHRDRIGVEMNGDYEDALLRLLAGEGGYVALDSEAALRELREELETSNPNTGLYREFAAVDVRLVHSDAEGDEAPELDLAGGGPEGTAAAAAADAEAAEESDTGWGAPAAESGDGEAAGDDESPLADLAGADDADAGADAGPQACRWCRAELPDRANVNFCPFCGTDVRLVPCPTCGEELEPGWRFCAACGDEVAA